MASSNLVQILLELKGAGRFASDAGKSGRAIKGVGSDAETAGRKAGIGWKGVAKWAGGAAALGGAALFIKSSTTATVGLAKSSAGLTRLTGMDTKTASEWVQVAKSRGIEGGKLNTTFVKLSKQIDSAASGGKPAIAMFKQLGVSQDAIARGDTQTVINQAADALSKMTNPAERAAAATKLFGKSGNILMPILMKGSKGIRDQLKNVDDLGAALSNNKSPLQFAADQRNLGIAMEGVKLTIGTSLMPVMVALAGMLITVMKILRPLTGNATLFKLAVTVLVVAFVAYKAILIQTALAQSGLSLAWLAAKIPMLAVTAQMWLLNAAFLANPITWIVVGLVALAAGFYLAYTKIGWFRNGVQAVFGWVKANWPLLLAILTGPVGLAVLYIVRHWDSVVGAFRKIPARISAAASGMWNGVKNAFRAAINWVIRAWNGFELSIKLPGILGGARVGIGTPNLPLLAAGGIISRGGSAIVGDRGPELLNLPGGASVQPLSVSPIGRAALGADRPIVTQVYLDRRVLATAVGYDTADRLARR